MRRLRPAGIRPYYRSLFSADIHDNSFCLSIICFALIAVTYFLAASIAPHSTAAVQLIAVAELRGRLAAVYLLASVPIGQGTGHCPSRP